MKTEIYSWRLSAELKNDLEEAARRQQKSISSLLETIVHDWLVEQRLSGEDDEAEQQRLHVAAARTFGTIRGGDLDRSQNVRQTLQTKLAKRRHAS